MKSETPTSPSPLLAQWVPSLSPLKDGEGKNTLLKLPLRPWGRRGLG
jgi:hypothetical protein